VPKNPEQRIEEFATQIEQALGDNLLSLLVFGSVARGHYIPGRSDINLLMIVRDAGTSALHPAAGCTAAWTDQKEPAPLIFSSDEWRASADVFPLEIEDMREAHRVVRGTDPLAGVTTNRAHQRHQLEREVREKLLRLRAQYAAGMPDGESLGQLLDGSLGPLVVLLRATLRLAGKVVPADPAVVIQSGAETAGLDRSVFDWALARRAGRPAASLKPFDALAARYVDQVQKLAQYVNRL
jgi:hypothetical protein